jgi:ribosomal protein S18 acetylase RimI-like enzyme
VADHLLTIAPGPGRARWAALLELADEAQPLRRYLQQGMLYGLAAVDGAPRAAVLVVDRGDRSAELKAVAVAVRDQGRGIGTRVVREILTRLGAAGYARVIVGTSNAGVRQLAFYQRLGFRLSHIERDFFSAERGYPPDASEDGLPVRDMVWMDQAL